MAPQALGKVDSAEGNGAAAAGLLMYPAARGSLGARAKFFSPGPGREPAGPSRVADFGAQALEKARPATDSPIASKPGGLAGVEPEPQIVAGQDRPVAGLAPGDAGRNRG